MSETATSHGNVQHRATTDGINVMNGESVLENRRPGWSVWWKQLLLGVVVLFAGLGGDAPVGGLAAAGLVVGYIVISRVQSRYIVTDERVKSRIGLVSKQQREYRIPDIQSISSSQSLIERVFGHGSITVRTAAGDQITWVGVPEYQDVTNTIREQQRRYE